MKDCIMDLIQHPDGYKYHPTALIDPGAKIGKGSRIWAFSHIMSEAVIGEYCSIGGWVFVAGKVGDGCRIQNKSDIFKGVTLEGEVFVGPQTCFTNVKYPRCGNPTSPDLYIPTLVKHGASIGAGCRVRCGITIGKHAMIGMGSVVTKDVPDYGLVYAKAAKLQGFVDRLGRLTDHVT